MQGGGRNPGPTEGARSLGSVSLSSRERVFCGPVPHYLKTQACRWHTSSPRVLALCEA